MSIRYFMTSIKTSSKLALTVLLTSVSVQSAWATVLQDIHFSALPGQRFEVKLDFDQQPDSPQGYVVDQPARIVLDFPGVDNALKEKKFPLSFGNAQSAVVLAAGGRTRLILNMVELAGYQTRFDGSSLIVEVGEKQKVAEESFTARPSKTLASSAGFTVDAAKASIGNVDFRRGENGEGKIIVDLSDPHVSIDVEEKDGKILVSFLDTQLPQELRRRLDVTDFATPVTFVDVKYDGRDTQVAIDPAGDYDYLAYQADNEYVISVKPLTEQEKEELKSKFAYVGEKLSLNFQDIDVRAVLQLIADFTELNLVASDTVEGKITLRLDNVPWDQALEIVLKTKGLDSRQVGNVLMVAPAAEIAERERQELETQRQLQELAPLRTEFVQILYADAEELFKLFDKKKDGAGGSGGGDGPTTASILSERGSAIVDTRTNSIILTDTEEKISAFRKLIKQIDIPIRQVMIEARIVVANTDFTKELGVNWGVEGYKVSDGGTNGFGFGGSRQINVGDGMVFGDFIDFDGDGELEEVLLNDTTAVDLGVLNPAGSFAFSVLSDNFFVDLELSALEDSGYAEIVSQPKVITGDKQVAYIESGKEIPYQEASASGATTTSFKEAVLKLEVTPQITPDDRVIMSLKINQDTVGDVDSASDIPIIDVTQLETKVLVGNGETIVLGGIFQNETVNGVTKVPLLGDIPVVGNLFKKTSQSDQKRELIIFITPRILSPSLTD